MELSMNINMHLVKLAFRNVFRNKRRSILTMVIIMFSVGTFLFMQSYFEGLLTSVIKDSIKSTGHLCIQHPRYDMKSRMLSLSVPVDDLEAMKKKLLSVAGVRAATGRIKFGGLIDFGESNEPGLGMGIEPEAERDIMELENSIIDGTYFSGAPNETVIGREFSNKLNIAVGDTVTVIARTAYSSLTAENLIVTGIADLLVSQMNRFFYMPLETAQTMLDMRDKCAELIVFLDNRKDTPAMLQAVSELPGIRDTYSVLSWQEKGKLEEMLPLINIMFGIMTIIFGMIAAFSIINTMLMAVLERTSEIGVFTAFGMTKGKILRVFLFEAMFLGIFGGLLGLALGGLGGYAIETYGITIGDAAGNVPIPIRQVVYGDLQWKHALISLGMGVILALGAAYFPARKAAKLEPVDALRHR